MEITAIICLMCTIVGCLVGYFGFRRNQNNDIRTETKEDTRDKVQSSTTPWRPINDREMLTPDSIGPGFNIPNVGVKRNSITTTGFTMVYSSNYTAGLTNKISYLAIE